MPREYQAQFVEGIELFNRGEFFACHEVLEELWTPSVPPERQFLQSLIHFAVGFHHHRLGNAIGASRQLQKGLLKIGDYLPQWNGVDTAAIEKSVRGCLAIIEAGGKIEHFPTIQPGR